MEKDDDEKPGFSMSASLQAWEQYGPSVLVCLSQYRQKSRAQSISEDMTWYVIRQVIAEKMRINKQNDSQTVCQC